MANDVVAVGTREIPVETLYWDKDLYPRVDVSTYNVMQLADKMSCGVNLEPIVVEEKTNRIVDGVHRVHATKRLKLKKIKAHVFRYRSTPIMLRHSIQLNNRHGMNLSQQDLVRLIGMLQNLNVKANDVPEILSISTEKFDELKMRLAWEVDTPESKASGIVQSPKTKGSAHFNMKPVPLKYGTRHLNGKELTKEQVEANDKYTGHEQVFSVNNVIRLIEGKILDTKNARLMERIRHLKDLLQKFS